MNPNNIRFDAVRPGYHVNSDVDNSMNTVYIPDTVYKSPEDIATLNNSITSIMTFNIRSIPKNFQQFMDEIMAAGSFYPEIIGLNEIRLHQEYTTLYEISGYNGYFNVRNVHGGGVAMFLKDDIISEKVPEFTVSLPHIETLSVATKQKFSRAIYICIYRPPNGKFSEFYESLQDILSEINTSHKYKSIFVLGDLNIDMLKPAANTIDFINLMYSYSLFPTINRPTRVSEETASLIDHIWTTEIHKNSKNFIIETDITDHYPIVSQFAIFFPEQGKKLVKKRVIHDDKMQNFILTMQSTDWTEILNCEYAQEAFDLFHAKFIHAFENQFPVRIISDRRKNAISPYITTSLKKCITEKNRLKALFKKWPITYGETYRKYRNKLVNILRAAKNQYYKDKLNEYMNDPKKQWSILNSLMGRTQSKSDVIELNPPRENSAEAFNSHFSNINIGQTQSPTRHRRYLTLDIMHSLFMEPTSGTEITGIIFSIKSNSPGYDDIPSNLLKKISPYISSPLCHVFNLCLREGHFPDQMKLAKVLPIHKSGDKHLVSNYRPISILPSLGKIFETIINIRLSKYLEKNNLLADEQFGFRDNRSTEKAVLRFVQEVFKALEAKDYPIGIFIDLSKAFDSLNHEILFDKLVHLGIRGTCLKLFKSYLGNRKQFVQCNNEMSSVTTIRRGVPQGSILGPTLFLIYINDLTKASEKFHFTIYADDTTLLLKDTSLDGLHTALNSELNKIEKWVHDNDLKINTTKTKCVLFKNRSLQFKFPEIVINGEPISVVSCTKFLGLKIDENLNWKQHIDDVCGKLSKITGILYRTRYNLTADIMMSLYYSLFYSQLTYCISIWAGTWTTFLKPLQIAQDKFIRCINFMKKFQSTKEIYKSKKILNIKSIHNYFSILLIKKTFEHGSPFERIHRDRQTRANDLDLIIPPFRTELFKNSIICSGPRNFNNLPADIKELITERNISTFKKKLKQHVYAEQMRCTDTWFACAKSV